ncbi:hypothetical protein RYH80_18230 [Halobaculum sp. MBLA0147]|uniref:hypothetical protein n=1 Tax=Halobaculum sp. MBLA0147 TaxID=3079934 RepID=UPI0035264ECA
MRRGTPTPPTNPPEPSHYHSDYGHPVPEEVEVEEQRLHEVWRCDYERRQHHYCEATAYARYAPVDDPNEAPACPVLAIEHWEAVEDMDTSEFWVCEPAVEDVLHHEPKDQITIVGECQWCERTVEVTYEFDEMSPYSV